MKIKSDNGAFKDEHGRTLQLRGVNLGGSSKVPYRPDGASHIREGFFDHRPVSFVGRPFPLADADEHFKRLKSWGLTFLRFLVTWEAIEHAGPGIYDEAYLDYIQAVVKKASDYGFTLFIDPHQDVWSRFSGGDGAPGWTLEAAGLNIQHFKATGAAIVHQTHGDPFPRMVWPTNYTKLAAATMFTLFFGGNDFAPLTKIDGQPAQEYLQSHFINAIKQVAQRVRDIPGVIGYDTINEPSGGYIGLKTVTEHEGLLKMGQMPTPYQGMLLGSGIPQEVDEWSLSVFGPRKTGTTRIDPRGQTAWLDGYACIWQQNGVWGLDDAGQPQLLRPNHFARVKSRPVDFDHDYLRPFALRFAKELREVHPDAFMFFEPDSFSTEAPEWSAADAKNFVYAPHWYDAVTLMMKTYRSWLGYNTLTSKTVIGSANVRHAIYEQFKAARDDAAEFGRGVPGVIGETGIPYDMNNGDAFRTGDYHAQAQAMNATITGVESNLLNFTLWCYTPDNTHARGDHWNGEDLSIYSPDDRKIPADINSGGRALEAVVRPYARATAGKPVKSTYDMESGIFEFAFWHDAAVTAPTEFYIPDFQYPQGYKVEVSDGEFTKDVEAQTLVYRHTGKNIPHHVRVLPLVPRPVPPSDNGWRGLLVMVTVAIVLWRIFRRRR